MKKIFSLRNTLFVVCFIVLCISGNLLFLKHLGKWVLFEDIEPLPVSRPRRIVVSMSTFSTRIQLTALNTLEEMLQTQDMDRIIVTVSMNHRNDKGECLHSDCVSDQGIQEASTMEDVLHVFLKRFGEFKPVKITQNYLHPFIHNDDPKRELYLQIMTMKDFGPATKLLGALLVEKEPDTIIIVVDDDQFYTAGYFLNLAIHLPQNAIMGSMYQYLGSMDNAVFVDNMIYMYPLHQGHGVQIDGWLMGTGGVAYRVEYFTEDIFNEARQLSRECFLNDDVWLAGYMKKLKLTAYMYFGPSGYKHVRHATQSLSSIRGAQTTDLAICAKSYGFPNKY
jgi:hypothetical protein